jgi:hypothetical protein
LVTFAFWAAGIALALRNLRRGQGDRRGARRLALCSLGIILIGFVLVMHHVADSWEETLLILTMLAFALLLAAEGWIGYIAIEPLVRRRWPRILIGASRLLTGRFRDPMIGRDLLVGGTLGVAFALLRALTALTPGAAPLQSASLALSGVRYVGWFAAAELAISILGPVLAATLLVGVHVLTRNTRVSVIIVGGLAALILIGDVTGPLWVRAMFGLLAAIVVFFVLFRFGLLAFSAVMFAYLFLRRLPITLDTSAWYFGRSALTLGLLVAIAMVAFFTSLGGKRWLPKVAVDT